MTQTALLVMGCVLSLAASIISGLVLGNFRMLGKRQDRAELRLITLEQQHADYQRDFVNKVDYIRSTTSLERSITKLLVTVGEIRGTMKAIEQMPNICGAIVREIIKETKQ